MGKGKDLTNLENSILTQKYKLNKTIRKQCTLMVKLFLTGYMLTILKQFYMATGDEPKRKFMADNGSLGFLLLKREITNKQREKTKIYNVLLDES